MNQNEKLALAARIRQGMVVDPVIPDGFGQYPGRVERTEAVVPTSVGDSRLWILREKGKTGEGALPWRRLRPSPHGTGSSLCQHGHLRGRVRDPGLGLPSGPGISVSGGCGGML